MITLNIYYCCNAGQRDAFYKELCDLGIRAKSKSEPGSVQYDYFLDIQNPDTLMLVESWENQEALTLHGTTEAFLKLQDLKRTYCANVRVDRFEY